jgi:hypothetical protein
MNIMRKAYAYSGVATIGLLTALGKIPAAHAVSDYRIPLNTSDPGFNNPTNAENTITEVAGNIINILLVLAGVLAVLFLIYSGFLYITAGGSADKAKAARGGIINAVIGIIIIMASFFIVRFAIGIGKSAENVDQVYAPSIIRSI